MKKRWFLYGTCILFAADQILKSYTEQNMDKGEEKALTEHVVLRRGFNPGLGLNFFADKPRPGKGASLSSAGNRSLLLMIAVFPGKSVL